MNIQSLLAMFEKDRHLFLSIADNIVGDDAEDVVQDIFLKLNEKIGTLKVIDKNYIVKCIKHRAIDIYNKKKKIVTTEINYKRKPDALSICESEPIGFDDIDRVTLDLSDLEKTVFLKRTIQNLPYKEIALSLQKKTPAVRKMFQRAKNKIKGRVAYDMICEGEFSQFNKPRMKEHEAEQISYLFLKDQNYLDNLFAIFENKDFNRAIQNSTWILLSLCRKSPELKEIIEPFFINQLQNGDLYRGNKNYLSEALLDLSYRKYIYMIRREFILPLHDLEDRISPKNYTVEENLSLKMPCIFDVKKVRPIGREIKEKEVNYLLNNFLKGNGSVDYRRTVAFELLRLHQWNENLLLSVLNHLSEDDDQTNAYYVMKYLVNWGLKDHPSILNKTLIKTVEAISDRWSNNPFFLNTAIYLKTCYRRL